MKKAVIECGSVTGSREKKYGGHINQDAYCFKTVGDYVCAVVCDGAGSHKYADIGANAFAQDVCEHLAENAERIYGQDTDLTRKEIADVIRLTNRRLVTENGGEERDYGSTVLFVIVKEGSPVTLFGNLGDGALLIHFEDDREKPHRWFNVVSFPDGCGKATYLTNSRMFERHLRVERDERRGSPDRYKRIYLVTDGVRNHIFESNYGLNGKPLYEAVNKIYEEPPEDDATFVSIDW